MLLSICKELYIYIIYHRPFGLRQIILVLVLHILLSQSLILNSMTPVKKEIVECHDKFHDITRYAVCKSEDHEGAPLPAQELQPPGTPSLPLMGEPQPPSGSPLMSSPSSGSLDQSPEGPKYPPPGSISADKTLYNKINYRLRNEAMPDVVGKRYQELRQNPDKANQVEWEELLGHILGGKKGEVDIMNKYNNYQQEIKKKVDPSYVAKLREICTEDVEGEDGSWVPWNVAVEKEGGEDLLKEMVEAKTVICRRNPKLPASSKIPWPQNQQVQHVVESWSRKKRKVETERKKDDGGDLASFQEGWLSKAAHVTGSTNPVTPKAGSGDPPPPNTAAAITAAIRNINQA